MESISQISCTLTYLKTSIINGPHACGLDMSLNLGGFRYDLIIWNTTTECVVAEKQVMLCDMHFSSCLV